MKIEITKERIKPRFIPLIVDITFSTRRELECFVIGLGNAAGNTNELYEKLKKELDSCTE